METWGNERARPGGRGIQGHWILTTSSQWSIRLTLGKHDEPHFLKKEKIEAQRLKMIFLKNLHLLRAGCNLALYLELPRYGCPG